MLSLFIHKRVEGLVIHTKKLFSAVYCLFSTFLKIVYWYSANSKMVCGKHIFKSLVSTIKREFFRGTISDYNFYNLNVKLIIIGFQLDQFDRRNIATYFWSRMTDESKKTIKSTARDAHGPLSKKPFWFFESMLMQHFQTMGNVKLINW